MNIVPIVNILKKDISINTEVTIQGWVRTRRDSKSGISFITIYDGSCFDSLQVVVNNTLYNYNNEVLHLTAGCSVSITGKIVKSLGKIQSYEMQVKLIKVIGWVDDPNTYPISPKHHTLEYLREVSHLRPRTNLIGSMTRIRHTLAQSIHRFMAEQGFFWVSTPLITTSDTEGIGKMFRVSTIDFENLPKKNNGQINFNEDFFGKEAFLTVSGQLNGESYACALSKIYTFGPIFRAENSNTSRHLAEFWMVEPEIAFATLDDAIYLAESMLKYVFKSILIECDNDIRFFEKHVDEEAIHRIQKSINTTFVKIDYTESVDILTHYKHNFEKKVFWGMDLSSEHERFLAETYFKSPVVIKNYPKDIKAFYMRMNNDNKTVASMDIIVPYMGEIIGGSQREERLDLLDSRIEEMQINKENYWWYRDLRRYGTVPHSGFGLGLERLVGYVTGIRNIRDTIPFPRSKKSADF